MPVPPAMVGPRPAERPGRPFMGQSDIESVGVVVDGGPGGKGGQLWKLWMTVSGVEWCSYRERSLVPDLSGLFAVSHPAVAFVSGLGTAAQGVGDLGPAGPGGTRPGDGEVLLGCQLGGVGGELLDPTQMRSGLVNHGGSPGVSMGEF